MVLRKVFDKLRSWGELKTSSERPDKSNSSKPQQEGNRGGGDLKKKLKKVRSVRVAELDNLSKAPKKTGHLPLSKPPQQGKSPASISTDEPPNYMKSTRSYEARKEKRQINIESPTPTTKTKTVKISTSQATSKPISSAARALVKNPSLKRVRSSVKKRSPMSSNKATCSSTVKDSKTSKPVDVKEHDEASALKVCTYTYCSLHGHKHGAVPSLKRFFSTRRITLKAQKSIKLRGYLSIKKKGDKEMLLAEDVVNELFIEIHSKLQAQTLHQEWGESHLQESCSVTSFEDSGDKNSELTMEEIQVINQFLEYTENGSQEETQLESEKIEQTDREAILSNFLLSTSIDCGETASHKVCCDGGRPPQSTDFGNAFEQRYNSSQTEHSKSIVFLPHSPQRSVEENLDIQEACCGERQKDDAVSTQQHNTTISYDMDKDSVDDLQNNKVRVNDSSSLVSRPKVKYGNWKRQLTKYRERVKEFKPQPPRLLALPVEPETEQVHLKHQTVDERKAAEEWMIDNALRKALRRLASARERKVPLLVAAFETVMPQMCETLLRCDAAGNIDKRPAQTCSCN